MTLTPMFSDDEELLTLDEEEQEEEVLPPSKTYALRGNRIAGFIDEISAVKQAIYHILCTERYVYSIYNDDYGVELEQYTGEDYEYIAQTIGETLNDALTQDLRINSVDVVDINRVSIDKMFIELSVSSIYGDFSMEVGFSV